RSCLRSLKPESIVDLVEKHVASSPELVVCVVLLALDEEFVQLWVLGPVRVRLIEDSSMSRPFVWICNLLLRLLTVDVESLLTNRSVNIEFLFLTEFLTNPLSVVLE